MNTNLFIYTDENKRVLQKIFQQNQHEMLVTGYKISLKCWSDSIKEIENQHCFGLKSKELVVVVVSGE